MTKDKRIEHHQKTVRRLIISDSDLWSAQSFADLLLDRQLYDPYIVIGRVMNFSMEKIGAF